MKQVQLLSKQSTFNWTIPYSTSTYLLCWAPGCHAAEFSASLTSCELASTNGKRRTGFVPWKPSQSQPYAGKLYPKFMSVSPELDIFCVPKEERGGSDSSFQQEAAFIYLSSG